MRKRYRQFLLTVLVFCSFIPLLWAQSAAPDAVLRQIDAAVQNKTPQALSQVLQNAKGKTYYAQLESYLLQRARQLLINNDLDFAREVTLVIIDNNLDNFEAVDLYTSINSAIQKRDAQLAAAEEKRQVEELKKEASEVRAKENVPKEYKSVTNSSTGETVYLDQDFGNHYLPFSWQVSLGFINIGIFARSPDTAIKYGLSASGSFYYYGDAYTIGGDVTSDIMLLTFNGGQDVTLAVQAIASAAATGISRNLFGRLGFAANLSELGLKLVEPSIFLTPVIGIGFREVRLGALQLQGNVDYYPGHLFYPDMYAAFEAAASGSIIIADLDEIDINLNFGVRNTSFIKKTGFENQTRLFLSIGVGNND